MDHPSLRFHHHKSHKSAASTPQSSPSSSRFEFQSQSVSQKKNIPISALLHCFFSELDVEKIKGMNWLPMAETVKNAMIIMYIHIQIISLHQLNWRLQIPFLMLVWKFSFISLNHTALTVQLQVRTTYIKISYLNSSDSRHFWFYIPAYQSQP